MCFSLKGKKYLHKRETGEHEKYYKGCNQLNTICFRSHSLYTYIGELHYWTNFSRLRKRAEHVEKLFHFFAYKYSMRPRKILQKTFCLYWSHAITTIWKKLRLGSQRIPRCYEHLWLNEQKKRCALSFLCDHLNKAHRSNHHLPFHNTGDPVRLWYSASR